MVIIVLSCSYVFRLDILVLNVLLEVTQIHKYAIYLPKQFQSSQAHVNNGIIFP